MKDVLEYLENTAEVFGEKTAVIEEEKACSYLELLDMAKRVGSSLSDKNISKKPVPVLMEKGINALSSFFGAVYAGGFYVLLNPELPTVRLNKILDVLDTNFIITDNENF